MICKDTKGEKSQSRRHVNKRKLTSPRKKGKGKSKILKSSEMVEATASSAQGSNEKCLTVVCFQEEDDEFVEMNVENEDEFPSENEEKEKDQDNSSEEEDGEISFSNNASVEKQNVESQRVSSKVTELKQAQKVETDEERETRIINKTV